MTRSFLVVLVLLGVLGACGGSDTPDEGGTDGGSGVPDAGNSDSDSGVPVTPDGGTTPDTPAGGPVLTDRLTGVNWFGFETNNLVPHGLSSRDYKSMLKQIKDLGFNSLRLPWCSDTIAGSPSDIDVNPFRTDAYTGQLGLNLDLKGLTSIQVMDKILEECQRLGIKVILDNHSRAHDGFDRETLWLSHPLIQMRPKTSRKTRCSRSISPNLAMRGSSMSGFMLGRAA